MWPRKGFGGHPTFARCFLWTAGNPQGREPRRFGYDPVQNGGPDPSTRVRVIWPLPLHGYTLRYPVMSLYILHFENYLHFILNRFHFNYINIYILLLVNTISKLFTLLF